MTVPVITVSEPVGPEGGTILLLGPSLGTDSAELWAAAIPGLSAFRVLTWDLPGHGRSPSAVEAFGIGELAEAVADTMRRRGFERFDYSGVSLGGAVGLQLGLDHADQVRRVSVLASGARIGTPETWHDRAALVRSSGLRSVREQTSSRWFAADFVTRHPETVARMLDTLGTVDTESYALCCDALSAYDLRARLTEVQVPLLIGWGEFDQVAPEVNADEITSSAPGATAVRIDGVAHLPPVEQPAVTGQLLVAFHQDR